MIRNRKSKSWMLGLKRMNGLRLMLGLKRMNGLWLRNGLKPMNGLSVGLMFGLLMQGSQAVQGQPPIWTLDRCVKYALQHNVDVRLESRTLENYRIEHTLKQTQVMYEVGTKSATDVAQMQATLAADVYEVTHQQNLLTHAWMALKKTMNFPIGDSLRVDTLFGMVSPDPSSPFFSSSAASSAVDASFDSSASFAADVPSVDALYQQARRFHPQLKQAELEVRAAQYALRAARGALFPSLSVGAGISTSYYKNLGATGTVGFRQQFRDNRGEYVFATLSIPLFDRLERIGRIRRQRNEWRQAVDRLDRQQSELQRLIVEALADYEAVQRECVQLQQKVKADAWAARLTLRQYEEGLASAIEVQTASVTGLQSRAAWLKSRLWRAYYRRMLDYYQGIPLWNDGIKVTLEQTNEPKETMNWKETNHKRQTARSKSLEISNELNQKGINYQKQKL